MGWSLLEQHGQPGEEEAQHDQQNFAHAIAPFVDWLACYARLQTLTQACVHRFGLHGTVPEGTYPPAMAPIT